MALKYIAPAPLGNNANAGTLAAPWETIAYAYTNTSVGDTIYMADGTYVLAATPNMKDRTWIGSSGVAANVIINGASVTATNGISLYPSVATELQFCTITGFPNRGTSSWMFNMQWPGSSPFLTLRNVIIRDNYVGAFMFGAGQGSYTTCGFKFYNTLIYNTTFGGNNSTYFGSYAEDAPVTVELYSTILYNSSSYNIYLTNSIWSTTSKLGKNCIIVNAGAGTFTLYGLSGKFTYSCLYGTMSGTLTGTGNITLNPLFVDPANGNFRLQRTSPCLGTGVIF
jgi:hypothetical protein